MKMKSLSLFVECCHYSCPDPFYCVSNYACIPCMYRFQPTESQSLPAVSTPVYATSKLCHVTRSEEYPK